jgi:hypothetical protein
MTEQEIKDICNEYDINNYSINPDIKKPRNCGGYTSH